MRMRGGVIAVVTAAAGVAGCQAPGVFYHATKSVEQRQQDVLECDLRSSEATAAIASPFIRAGERSDLYSKCMRTRGYVLVPKQ